MKTYLTSLRSSATWSTWACLRPGFFRRIPLTILACMDESSKQQVKEVRTRLPVESGRPQKCDSEYERNGVSDLFLFLPPYLVGDMSKRPINAPEWTGRMP
jgi:hypothetical protein